jgi:hypothetical protein
MKKLLISQDEPIGHIMRCISSYNNTNLLMLPEKYVYIRYERLWYVSCTPWTGEENIELDMYWYNGTLYAESPGGPDLMFERIPEVQVELLRTFS